MERLSCDDFWNIFNYIFLGGGKEKYQCLQPEYFKVMFESRGIVKEP